MCPSGLKVYSRASIESLVIFSKALVLALKINKSLLLSINAPVTPSGDQENWV